MVIAIWVIAAILIGLWSLTAWGLHALMTLGGGWAGDLRPLIEQVPYGEVLERWVPGWQALLLALLDITQASLSWLGEAAPVLVWAIWAGGTALLAVTALGFTLMVMLLRKPSPPPPASGVRPAL